MSYERNQLSARDIAPIHAVWRLRARGRLVGTNALIDIHTSSFRVPNATLREKVPVDVELPDTRCVADDGRHDDGKCAERRDGESGCCGRMGLEEYMRGAVKF